MEKKYNQQIKRVMAILKILCTAGKPLRFPELAERLVREQGVPVNHNLRQELQTMRDELGIEGYEAFF